MKRNILITGSAGYLGTYLVRYLTETRDYNLFLPFEDVTSADFALPQVEVVIHLAGKLNLFKGAPDEIYRTNFQGTANLIEQCPKGVHFIYLSSDYVFRSHLSKIYREGDPTDPETIYGRAKADAEEILKNSHLQVTILRSSMLYGYDHPHRQNFFAFVKEKLGRGEQIELFTDVYSQPTYINDLCVIIKKVIDHQILGIYHACGRELVNRFELGQLICEVKNYDSKLLVPVRKPEGMNIPRRINLSLSPIFENSVSTNLKTGIARWQ